MTRKFQIKGPSSLSRGARSHVFRIHTLSPLLAICPLLVLAGCQDRNVSASTELPPADEAAIARLASASDSEVSGEVRFYPDGDNVIVSVNAEGLETGMHGFHIHETGDCSAPDASSAGEHFAPQGHQHGSPTMEEQHHAGDMGNIRADGNGVAMTQMSLDTLSLDNPNSIVGKAVIIHAQADDLQTQPSGDSGDRVACGVIQAPANA